MSIYSIAYISSSTVVSCYAQSASSVASALRIKVKIYITTIRYSLFLSLSQTFEFGIQILQQTTVRSSRIRRKINTSLVYIQPYQIPFPIIYEKSQVITAAISDFERKTKSSPSQSIISLAGRILEASLVTISSVVSLYNALYSIITTRTPGLSNYPYIQNQSIRLPFPLACPAQLSLASLVIRRIQSLYLPLLLSFYLPLLPTIALA